MMAITQDEATHLINEYSEWKAAYDSMGDRIGNDKCRLNAMRRTRETREDLMHALTTGELKTDNV